MSKAIHVTRCKVEFYEYMYQYKGYDVVIWNAQPSLALRQSGYRWSFIVVGYTNMYTTLPNTGFRTRAEAENAIPAYVERIINFKQVIEDARNREHGGNK
ncbi:MAG: hypothetical protein ACK5XN_25865 [Bacteroidota bacterium]|jgi:hypothetical protein